MKNEDWRGRLESAIEKSGMSNRQVSLQAGMGPGYVHGLLKEGKDPTVANLIAVCRVLNVTLSEILYAYKVTPQAQEILQLLERHPEKRDAILSLLRQ